MFSPRNVPTLHRSLKKKKKEIFHLFECYASNFRVYVLLLETGLKSRRGDSFRASEKAPLDQSVHGVLPLLKPWSRAVVQTVMLLLETTRQ